jgi:hypothetical protein
MFYILQHYLLRAAPSVIMIILQPAGRVCLRVSCGSRTEHFYKYQLKAGTSDGNTVFSLSIHRGVDTSLARPTSRCILFDGLNISYDASFVIHNKYTKIPPIMTINRIYETQNLPSL